MDGRALFAALALLVPIPGVSRAADEQNERYILQDDNWESGGHLRRRIASGDLPFNKSYGEMTPEEKDILKSHYASMGPNDEPPYPKFGLKPILNQIVKATSRLEVEGPLHINVLVDAEGQPTSVEVLKSPDPRMSKFAAAVLLDTPFKAALCEGKPCKMKFPLRFDLRLRTF